MALTTRQTVLLSLVAIGPIAVFSVFGPDIRTLIAAFNVVLITASLYIAFGPHRDSGSMSASF
jgi:hypothetical protein